MQFLKSCADRISLKSEIDTVICMNIVKKIIC